MAGFLITGSSFLAFIFDFWYTNRQTVLLFVLVEAVAGRE